QVRFLQQVGDLLFGSNDPVAVAIETNICRPDQVKIVPGNDEVWSPILPRLDVQGIFRRTGEGLDDNVTPLRPADQPWRLLDTGQFRQDLVNPRTGDIDRERRFRRSLFSRLVIDVMHATD